MFYQMFYKDVIAIIHVDLEIPTWSREDWESDAKYIINEGKGNNLKEQTSLKTVEEWWSATCNGEHKCNSISDLVIWKIWEYKHSPNEK